LDFCKDPVEECSSVFLKPLAFGLSETQLQASLSFIGSGDFWRRRFPDDYMDCFGTIRFGAELFWH